MPTTSPKRRCPQLLSVLVPQPFSPFGQKVRWGREDRNTDCTQPFWNLGLGARMDQEGNRAGIPSCRA